VLVGGGHVRRDRAMTAFERGALSVRPLDGIIDQELLPSAVTLAHDQIELSRPGAITLTASAVLKALGSGALVLLPQQAQGVIDSTSGAPLPGIGVRTPADGNAGAHAGSLRSDGRPVDNAGTVDARGPPTRGTPP
jgi:hypothetical protein